MIDLNLRTQCILSGGGEEEGGREREEESSEGRERDGWTVKRRSKGEMNQLSDDRGSCERDPKVAFPVFVGSV